VFSINVFSINAYEVLLPSVIDRCHSKKERKKEKLHSFLLPVFNQMKGVVKCRKF